MTKQFSNYSDLLTFTRASKGHALRPVSYGDELVTNGTFDTDTSNWTGNFSGVTLSVDNQRLKIAVSGGASGYAYQDVPTVAGKVYALKVDKTDGTNTAWGILVESTNWLQGPSSTDADGSYEYYFVASDTSTNLRFYVYGDGTHVFYDNVSVKEVTFDESDGTLTLFEHPDNVPRVEYDADGNRLGLLVEEARTNLFPYSEDFGNAAWVKNAGTTVTTNYATSPDGTQNATRYIGTGASGFADKLTLSAGDYALSFWVKSNTGQDQYCRIIGESDKISGDLLVTSEWQRLELAFTATGGTNKANGIFRDTAANDIDILVWGAQLEAGSFPTSYIKTTGATATRSADVASIPVADFGFNDNEGTLFINCLHFGDASERPLSMSDGSNTSQAFFKIATGSDPISQIITAGVNVAQLDTTSARDSGYKAAMTVKENDFAVSVDGNSVAVDTNGGIGTYSIIHIGRRQDGLASTIFNGHIKKLTYYPRRLTDAQLQEITS